MSEPTWQIPAIEINAGLTRDDVEAFGRWLRSGPFGYYLPRERPLYNSTESLFQTWLLVAFLAGRRSVYLVSKEPNG